MSAPVPGAQLELGLRIPALGGVDEPRLLGFIDVLRQPRADGDQRGTHWRPAGTKPKSDGPARESHDTEHLC